MAAVPRCRDAWRRPPSWNSTCIWMPSEIGHLKPDNETHKSCKDAQRCAKMQKLARCLHEGLIWPNLARNCVLLIVFWLAHGIARIKVGSVLFVLFLLGSKSDQKSELPKVRVRGGDAVMSGKFLWSLRSINVLSILICFLENVFHSKIQAGHMFFKHGDMDCSDRGGHCSCSPVPCQPWDPLRGRGIIAMLACSVCKFQVCWSQIEER